MNEEIMRTFKSMCKIGFLTTTGVFSGFFRFIGWWIIKILAVIVNGIDGIVNKLYMINTFFYSKEVTDLINTYKPLIWTILTISIAFLGFKLIMNKQSNRREIPTNILLAILVVTFLTAFMIKLNNVTKIAISGLDISSPAEQIASEYITDNYYLDEQGYTDISYGQNDLGNNIFDIDINEEIDTDNISNDYEDMYENKPIYSKDGSISDDVEELDDGFLGIGEEGYYRYSVDYLPLIVSLLATAVAMVCVCIKLARLIFELAFNNFFATLFAFADIEDGRKLKEIIKHILSIFAVIFATGVMLKLYMLFSSWVNTDFKSNVVLRLVLLIGASLSVIDGPNLIEKILGIDAGLKSSWGVVAAGMAGTRMAASIGSAVGSKAMNIGSSIARNTVNAGAMAMGGASALGKNGFNNSTNVEKSLNNIAGNNMSNNSNSNSSATNKNNSNNSNSTGSNSIKSNMEGFKGSNSGSLEQGNNNLGSSANELNTSHNKPMSLEQERAVNNNPTMENQFKNNSINSLGNNMTIGDAIKDKVSNNKTVQSAKRSYDMGYNTVAQWKFKKKGK